MTLASLPSLVLAVSLASGGGGTGPVVILESAAGSGRGFFIDGGRKLVASSSLAHKGATIRGGGGRTLSLLSLDRRRGVAVFSTDRAWPSSLALEAAPPRLQDQVYVPASVDQPRLSGQVRGLHRKGDRALVQLAGAGGALKAGTPLLNERGRVVGMLREGSSSGGAWASVLSARSLQTSPGRKSLPQSAPPPARPLGFDPDKIDIHDWDDEPQAKGLWGLRAASITIDDLPEELAKVVDVDALWKACQAALKESSILVYTDEEQVKELDDRIPAGGKFDMRTWATLDGHAPYLFVSVNTMKLSDEAVFYSLDVCFYRTVMMYPGFTDFSSVWEDGIIGVAQIGASSEEAIVGALQSVLEDLARDIKYARTKPAPAPGL